MAYSDQSPGDRLPAATIREIRKLRCEGYTRYHISLLLDVSPTCVTRYCRDLPLPCVSPLPAEELNRLLKNWRRPCDT